LQLHQVKNIYVHDFFADNPEKPDSNRRRYHILGSCFSAKHCWRTGLELKNAFNLKFCQNQAEEKKIVWSYFCSAQRRQRWGMGDGIIQRLWCKFDDWRAKIGDGSRVEMEQPSNRRNCG